jgi:2-methylisocitrate lyase-like PEP mutase family enzyme
MQIAQSVAAFRKLHESGCFVLPNPWDIGSAMYLQHLGFKALATTSAGFAFSQGLPDLDSAIPMATMLAHFRQIVGATSLPVNADFQSGYAREPEGVARNVTLCVQTGVAGLSVEDATHDMLLEKPLSIERIRAARTAIDTSGVPVVLTARCEAWLIEPSKRAREAIDRLVAFADAGADCLFAPGILEPQSIAAIVEAVAPKPVNVLVSSPQAGLSVAKLADLGVRRISVGVALACAAWGAFMRAAKSIASTGEFGALADAAPSDELNNLFLARKNR